jgi:myo-inositol 2-dehydrogenase/D-chiro-inositol 1-dehydrogenase
MILMSASPSARIAFVGAGNHATQSLYPNLPLIPEFTLVAVCDLVRDRAEYAAARYGAEAFTDVDAMLDAVRLDGVCVCGPAEMHHDVALQVLARGLPVFLEKPPAADLAGACEVADAARKAGTFGMCGFMKRFAPANVLAKEHMVSEAFGLLSSIGLIHGAGPYDDMRRMLYFNGIHMIDLARFFGGEVKRLSAFGFDGGPGIKTVCANLEFDSGAVGQFNCNSGHTWTDCFEQVYLSGSQCGILIDASARAEVMSPEGRFADGEGLQLGGWSRRYYVSGNMSGWWAGGHYTRGYWGELSHFARAVLGLVEPTPTLDDGAEAVRLIEAMLASLASA